MHPWFSPGDIWWVESSWSDRIWLVCHWHLEVTNNQFPPILQIQRAKLSLTDGCRWLRQSLSIKRNAKMPFSANTKKYDQNNPSYHEANKLVNAINEHTYVRFYAKNTTGASLIFTMGLPYSTQDASPWSISHDDVRQCHACAEPQWCIVLMLRIQLLRNRKPDVPRFMLCSEHHRFDKCTRW